MPWGTSELPAIVRAVVTAAVEAGREREKRKEMEIGEGKGRGTVIRAWFLGGFGVIDMPGTMGKKLVVD